MKIHRFRNFQRFRIIVCLTAWFALFSLYSQRVNLSIGIIGMTKGKSSKGAVDANCPSRRQAQQSYVDNTTRKYDWDEGMQNYILLAYNVGYLLMHIPGALLSIQFGPRKVMLVCLLASTILTFASIPAAENEWVFFIIRAMVGLANGSLYPIIHETIANHAPAEERTWMSMLTHTGNIISLVVTFPVGGQLVESVVDGWKYIFVLTGGFGILSFICWLVFVYSEPDENPWMAKAEQQYIVKSIYPNGKPPQKTIRNIPFRQIFMCKHIYILMCAHFGKLFILYMNLFGLVKYLYTYYGLTRAMAGNLAVIPFIADFAFQLVYPKIVQVMRSRGLSITPIRRINTFIGAFGCSAFLIVAGFLPCTNLIAGIIALSCSLLFLAPYQAGYFTAIIEIAPQYSGIDMAVINVSGSLAGVVQRYITAALIMSISDIRMAYRYSFILTGGVSFILSMAFVLFGSADLQPFARTAKALPSLKPTSLEDSQDSSNIEVRA